MYSNVKIINLKYINMEKNVEKSGMVLEFFIQVDLVLKMQIFGQVLSYKFYGLEFIRRLFCRYLVNYFCEIFFVFGYPGKRIGKDAVSKLCWKA